MRVDVEITDPEERRIAGLDPREPSPVVLRSIDGVEVRQRPQVMLDARPWAQELVDRFRVGATREISSLDYSRLSAFEIECVLTMAQAYARARAPKAASEGQS